MAAVTTAVPPSSAVSDRDLLGSDTYFGAHNTAYKCELLLLLPLLLYHSLLLLSSAPWHGSY